MSRKNNIRVQSNTVKDNVTRKKTRTLALILNRLSCCCLVRFNCFRTMDILQLMIQEIAITPTIKRQEVKLV